MKKILIVEDDKVLNNGIADLLESSDTLIHSAFHLNQARELFDGSYDLIILDINLPDGSGLDFLREIRTNNNVPIIILTANDMEKDEIKGLEMGADDYITKPFSLNIFKARVESQLREKIFTEVYKTGKLSFDFDRLKFFKDKDEIKLNKIEIKLLKYLIDNRGMTLTRDNLLDTIWTDSGEYVYENTLSVTIKRLRDKIENDAKNPEYIKTVYGLGYFWEERR